MGRQRQALFTIGYSGHTLDTFIQTLHTQKITVLLDIRMTAISRKRGFSKNALRTALENEGIRYVHMRPLGSPADLRRTLFASHDYDEFFDAYRTYLDQQSSSLNQAAELASTERVCLMCVEREPHECHRSVVAGAILGSVERKMNVHHLSISEAPNRQTATVG